MCQNTKASSARVAKAVVHTPQQNKITYFLHRAKAAFDANDYAAAADWAHHAKAASLHFNERQERLLDVLTSYVDLINSTCRRMRQLLVTNGQVVKAHKFLTNQLYALARGLWLCLSLADHRQTNQAATIHALVNNLVCLLESQGQISRHHTTVSAAGHMMEDLRALQVKVRHLGVNLPLPYGSSQEILSLARTAVSNCQQSMTWFMSKRFSDWDKAQLMCRWACQLLSEHVSTEQLDNQINVEQLDRLHARLNECLNTLANHHYWLASRQLKQVMQELDQMLAGN